MRIIHRGVRIKNGMAPGQFFWRSLTTEDPFMIFFGCVAMQGTWDIISIQEDFILMQCNPNGSISGGPIESEIQAKKFM